MKYNLIEPFIPSGADFQSSRQLFLELGFNINWEVENLVGFENNGCRFILQKYDVKEFAENLMMRVMVDDLNAFWEKINNLKLTEKFDVKLVEPTDFPWGREVNLIDIAGVCWHFAESN